MTTLHDRVAQREWAVYIVAALIAGVAVGWHPAKAIDYQVYFENARHYFAGSAMYGPASGTGWAGGVYRYPPLFLDLFRGLAWLPLAWGAALWAAGKVLVLGALVTHLRRRWKLKSAVEFWPGLILIAPYFVQELRYGNAQFYIVALCIVGLLHLRASAALGLAAALKVWPLFFLPCLFFTRRWRATAWATASALGLTLLPGLWRGMGRQITLLGQWLTQERAIGKLNEAWYPGQSLHDVLLRYLTVVDYGQLPDAAYRQVAWLHWSPLTVEYLWWALVSLLMAGLFYALARTGYSDGAVAAMFCAVIIVEPHVHRVILETALFPALWISARRGARAPMFWLAVAMAAVEPLIPGGARQRVMQIYGIDFWFVVLPLTWVVCVAWLRHLPDITARAQLAH